MAAGAIGMPWVAVALGMPFILWLEWTGARGWQIGLLVTIQQLMVVFQLPSAILTERRAQHKRLWASLAIPHRLLWMVPGFLSLGVAPVARENSVYIMMLIVAISGALGAAPVPLWFCWMGRLIPPTVSGRFWGTRQAVVMAAFMASMLAVGFFMDQAMMRDAARGFACLFILVALLGALDIVVHLGVPEPENQDIPQDSPSLPERLRRTLRHRDYLRFCAGMGSVMFALGLIGSFIPVYLKRDFNFTFAEQAILPVCNAAGTLCAGLVLGRLIDRIGSRPVVIGLIGLAPLTAAGWFGLTDGTWLLFGWPLRQVLVIAVLIHLCGGFLYGGIAICQLQMVTRFVPAGQKLFGTALFWVLIGLFAATGPLMGGMVLDLFERYPIPLRLPGGRAMAFFHVLLLFHVAVMWLIALPQFRRLAIPRGERPLRHHILSIIPGNSFRAVVNTMVGPLSGGAGREQGRADS